MFVLLRQLDRLRRGIAPPPSGVRGSLALRHVDAGFLQRLRARAQRDGESVLRPPAVRPQTSSPSPRHADVLLVTGAITSRMAAPLLAAYEAMPEPRLVAALGDCALGCGVLALRAELRRSAGRAASGRHPHPGLPADPARDRRAPARGARSAQPDAPVTFGCRVLPVEHDYDWLVVGSGFGGSVSALRLREKGYSVGVLECGRRFADDDLPSSTWDVRRYFWAPRLGMRGIFRLSIVQGRRDRQRRRRRRRLARLREHALPRAAALLRGPAVGRAGRLGGRARAALRRGRADARRGGLRPGRSRRRPAARVRERDRRARTRTRRPASACSSTSRGGETVPDPYFGGAGPDRTGCLRCGRCMIGCPHGAKNTLVKNYLWLAERAGAEVLPEREVVDVRPLGAADGSEGYEVDHRAPGRVAAPRPPPLHRARRRGRRRAARHQPAARRLQAARLAAALSRPRSATSCAPTSEAILAVTLPRDAPDIIERGSRSPARSIPTRRRTSRPWSTATRPTR